MGTITKKIASVVLSTTTVIWLSGVMPIATAATIEELTAQINALMAQLQALQAQQASQPTTVPTITSDLTIGSRGDQVTALQSYLISQGYLKIDAPTAYFGPLTQAAVAAWQTANNVSPAAGYFGPKSRAALAALGVAVPTVPTVPSVPTVPTVPVGAGMAIRLASDSPTGSAIAGAGQVDVAKFVFASGEKATITELKFKKVGVLSDANINNLYLADEAGKVIAQYSSLSSGVATFSGVNIQINAGETKTYTLRMDLSGGAASGNTIAWQLDTVTAGTVTVTGLPVTGSSLTVTTVSNPSLATAAIAYTGVSTGGGTVTAGTNSVLVASKTITVGNSAVNLKSVKYTVVGSVNFADLKNVKLMLNGSQVGTTLTSVSSDGTAVFDLSASPARIGTGASVLDVYADVAGSPNRTMTWQILRPYDVVVVDTQYNTGISASITGTLVAMNIQQGQITTGVASDTPSGNIPTSTSNVTLAKFTVYASGEPVKIKFLDVNLTQAGSANDWATAANVNNDIQNIRVVDDQGQQVGNTITTVTGGPDSGQCTLAASTISCHIGTSASPINYIVPANTTRVLSVKVDIQSGNDVTSLQATLPGNTSNLEGQISFQSANTGAANGSTLTVVTTPLTVAINAAFAAPTYVAGATNVKIASFVITATSAQGARINSMNFDKDLFALDIQNVKVMIAGTQFGVTRPTVNTTAADTFSFSGGPAVVNAGSSMTVDIYADILTGSATEATVIDFTGWSAVGTVSNASITFPGAVDGQNITVAAGAAVTIALDSATPAAAQLVMGSTDNSVLKLRFSETANVEDVKINSITLRNTMTGNSNTNTVSFQNMKLYDGATLLSGPVAVSPSSPTASNVTFSLATPVIIPKNSSKTLELKGSIADFVSGGAVSGSTHTWGVSATTSLAAVGSSSNQTITAVTGTPSGNAFTVLRTKLGFTSAILGSTSGRVRQAVDDIATITWTANAADQLTVNTITLTFTGLAVSTGTSIVVDLIDADTGTTWGSTNQVTTTTISGNTANAVFNAANYIISAGSSKSVKVRVNSSNFYNAAQTSESMSVVIGTTGAVTWSDGSSAATLEQTKVPFTVVNVSYE